MTHFNYDYIVNGIALQEIEPAQPTSRCLPIQDKSFFEMQAIAVNENGQRYAVTWIFQDNGEENYDDYDYSEPEDCFLID